jgi:S-sulfo-L-cysteine synthase (3-phospho-L-serine-dependent)
VNTAAVLFIESNTSGTGRLFARTARAMGFRPVLVTARPKDYAWLSEADAPEAIVVSGVGEESLAHVIEQRFPAGRGIAGITSSSEYYVATAAALAARFKLPGPDPASVRCARDKSCQRKVLAKGGLPTPEFRVAATPDSAMYAASDIGLPVVVKPLDGSGSVGVRACQSASEAGWHAWQILSRMTAPPPWRAVLVESLIDGPEISVEVFSGRVIGITRKYLGAPPHFVEVGHDYPATLAPEDARAAIEVATRGSELLGLGWGPLHWELRIRNGRAFPIEVNPRLAGGFIPELVRYAHGIDLIRETLRLVTGEHPDPLPCRRRGPDRYASIRFLLAPGAGRFAAADGLADARAAHGVEDVALYRAIGDQLRLNGDFRDRIGHAIACGPTARDAASAAQAACDAVAIRLVEHAA